MLYDDLCPCGCGLEKGLATTPFHVFKSAPNKFIQDYEECYVWQGRKNKYSYGIHKSRLVHKLYYEELHGKLDSGIFLDHLCRNRGCVNPAHLEPVDNKENIRRSPHTKLSKKDSEDIKGKYRLGLSYRKIAAEYNVSKTTIELIVKGKLWND